MIRGVIRRYAIVLAAWLPFFAIWVLYAMLYAHYRIVRRRGHESDFDGQCEPAWNRCLARLPTLAMAAPARPEVLLAAHFLCVLVLNSLEYCGLWAGVVTAWNQSVGFLESPLSWLATSDGSLAIRTVRGSQLCGADAESAARKRDAGRACRGAGRRGAVGRDSLPFESTLPVQCSAHAVRFGEVPAQPWRKTPSSALGTCCATR